MSLGSQIWERLRALVFRAREEREAADELSFHLELETAKNVAAGMTPAEARRAARLAFGGADQVREEVRSQRGFVWLDHLLRDLRHSWRTVLRMPGFALVVVLSLGIGIGVNTAIFSWLQTVRFRPIPGVRNASEFHVVEPVSTEGAHPDVSWPEYGDLKARLRSFPDLIAFTVMPLEVGEPGRNERTYGQLVSGNFFSALELRPEHGRFFGSNETVRGSAARVAVISYGFWQKHFGGSLDVVGRTLRVNDRDLTVLGVAPREFQGSLLGLDFDLWVPVTVAPELFARSFDLDDRARRDYTVMGRLRPGMALADAQVEVSAALRDLARLYPATNRGLDATIIPFWQALRGPQRFFLGALILLQSVMLLLLLAVCANTANLMLARASTRQREVAVRQALGAGRWRIVSLLLTESFLLALLGAGLGIAIAVWGTNALRAVPVITAFPIRYQTQLDGLGLAFALALAIVCALLFGLGPALHMTRAHRYLGLRSGARVGRSRLRNAVMFAEVTLALVVLIVAGTFLQKFRATQVTETGFQRAGVLLAQYDLSMRNVEPAPARDFTARLLERLRALPGVEGAAVALSVPLDIHGLPVGSFTLEGRPRADASRNIALTNVVTPGYFEALGIPIKGGRDFADLNDGNAVPQAIVNEAFIRRFFLGEAGAVGGGGGLARRLHGGAAPPASPPESRPHQPHGARVAAIGRALELGGTQYIITGVVENSLYESFAEPPTPIIYLSYRDRPMSNGQIHLRTRPGQEYALISEVRRVIRQLDASLPLFDVRTMNQHVERNLFFERVPARMFAVLGPLLLLLAAIGIYAVVAFTVARRTAEIGLRLALGATARTVIAQVMRENLRVVGYGVLAGCFLILLIYMHLPGTEPPGPPILLGVPGLLLLVAAVACWLPARRVTRVDPTVALRQD